MKKENKNKKIVSPQSPAKTLTDLVAWKDAFLAIDKKPLHLKKGRSACSLARYFLSRRAAPEIVATLNVVEKVVEM